MSQPVTPKTPPNSFISSLFNSANNLITLISPRNKSQSQLSSTPRSAKEAIETSGIAAAVAFDESKSPKGSIRQRGSIYEDFNPAAEAPKSASRNLTVNTETEESPCGPYTMTPADVKAKRTEGRLEAVHIAIKQLASGIYNLVSPAATRIYNLVSPAAHRGSIYTPYVAPTLPEGENGSYCAKASDEDVQAAKDAYHKKQATVACDESKSPKGSIGQRGSIYEDFNPAAEAPKSASRNLTVNTETTEEFPCAPYTMTPPDARAQRTESRREAVAIANKQLASGVYNLISPVKGHRGSIYTPYIAPTLPEGENGSYSAIASDADVQAVKDAYHKEHAYDSEV